MKEDAEERDAGMRRRGDAERREAASMFLFSPRRRRVSASPRLPVPFHRVSSFVWAITATLMLAFVSTIVVAPVAEAHGYGSIALLIYTTFGKFCHQIPERSFFIDGHPFAVCARCTGIYTGAALGVFLYPLVRSLNRVDAPGRKWLLLALVPTAIDFSLGFFGILENTEWSRFLTGTLLGGVTAFYVVPGLMDLSRMYSERALLQTSEGKK